MAAVQDGAGVGSEGIPYPLKKIRRTSASSTSSNDNNNESTTTSASSLPPVVLVSCGSFSPVTILHLRLFEMARDWGRNMKLYNAIQGILSPVSDAYGKKGLASAQHRVKMCDLAVESSEWLEVDHWEANQVGYTFTVQVLRSMKQRFVEAAQGIIENPENVVFKLLCGTDLLESFTIPGVWGDADVIEIIEKFGVVCVQRPGADTDKTVDSSDLLRPRKHNIIIVEQSITNDVSSTKIRAALKRGDSIKYLTPDPVIDYIKEQRLYR